MTTSQRRPEKTLAPLLSDLAAKLPEDVVRKIYRDTIAEMTLGNPALAKFAKKAPAKRAAEPSGEPQEKK